VGWMGTDPADVNLFQNTNGDSVGSVAVFAVSMKNGGSLAPIANGCVTCHR